MTEGMIFDIQRFSVNDGPGIRTTVFFKGCPLACQWCHNPEGQMPKQQVRYRREKCLGCRRCESFLGCAPTEAAGHEMGGQEALAAKACPGGALIAAGKRCMSGQLLEEIARDRDFYGSRGGVTFSGGEPLGQPEFLEEMLRLCQKNGIHTAIDTCGYAKPHVYRHLISMCGLVLFDIKSIDAKKHRQYTGVDNTCILKNFIATAEAGKPVWVRVPLIRNFNASREELRRIAAFLLPYRDAIQRLTLIPYHSFGNTKYPTVGLIPETFEDIDDDTLHLYENYFVQQGFVVGR